MESTQVAHPPIVSREEWRMARIAHLQKEKELTKEHDRLRAERRRLPMVRLEKRYEFEGVEGRVSLLDLFQGQRQLIVYHFMFDPAWEKGCPGCTGLVDAIADLSMLADRNTRFICVARAPYEKLAAYRAEKGWDVPFYSSFESDFNYDFHVTHDPAKVPVEYNYKSAEELMKGRENPDEVNYGEAPGVSVFFAMDGDVFHTYSSFARGVESLTDSYALLDITPYGRQEDFEDSPDGWPQKPTYG
ncbi:MAG: DUF899 domain-containing protein [Fimbriimonadaceae bacterium]|nr:DUF899 domain-containing protein [Fimbriimonadaceae bacterium]